MAAPQAPAALDRDLYARQGFLTLGSFLSPVEVADLRAEADRVLALCAAQPRRYRARIQWERDHLAGDERRGMEPVIRKLEPVSDLSPAFAALARHPGITGPVSALLGEAVELFEDKLNLKLPGGSTYPWHQDWNCCWRGHTDELITCFLHLDDADAVNGCLQVVPGSQRGKRLFPFRPGGGFEVDAASFDPATAVPVPLAAGEMIVFDAYLLHHSDRNRSRSPRRAIIYTYNPARLGRVNEGRFPADRD